MANQREIKDLIVIFSLLALSTCSEAVRFCFVGENGTAKEYDSLKEICCRNVLYKYDNKDLNCCGNVTYDTKKEICCQSQVFRSVVNNTHFACCAGQPYRIDQRKICCNNTLLTKSNTALVCCGDRLFDESKRGCCASEIYDQETHYCFEKQTVLPNGFDKCGRTTFKMDRYICCSGQLHNRSNGMTSCCGNQPYNKEFNKCCHTSEVPHIAPLKGHACCGSSHYNIENQICCNSQVMDAKPTDKCCGVALFDEKFQGCCEGIIYNTSSHRCCESSVISAHGRCCGSKELDVKNEVCCNNRFPLKKSDKTHNACCPNTELKNTGISYDKEQVICREGNPPEITIYPAYKTCGRKPYDEFNDLCCLDEVYIDGRINGKECCLPGNQAYHPDTEICCDGRLYDKTIRKGCVTDENPSVEPFSLIKDKKVFTYGICTICNENWKKEDYRQAIENEDINICLKSALKVEVLRVSHIKRRGKILQTSLSLKVRKNLYNPRGFPEKRGKINILLPCSCSIIYSSDLLLFVTNIDMRKIQLRLGDSDVLVPYFPRLRKAVKQRHGQCDRRTKTNYIKSINDIQDYINYQLSKSFF